MYNNNSIWTKWDEIAEVKGNILGRDESIYWKHYIYTWQEIRDFNGRLGNDTLDITVIDKCGKDRKTIMVRDSIIW